MTFSNRNGLGLSKDVYFFVATYFDIAMFYTNNPFDYQKRLIWTRANISAKHLPCGVQVIVQHLEILVNTSNIVLIS